jgi:hypothetical protein
VPVKVIKNQPSPFQYLLNRQINRQRLGNLQYRKNKYRYRYASGNKKYSVQKEGLTSFGSSLVAQRIE